MSIEEQLVNRIDIVKALSRLTEEQRQAVLFHYWRNQTCEDMATSLGWRKWKPKKRIFEALCTIRSLWGIRLRERFDEEANDADAGDCWWPVLMKSLWRQTQSSDFWLSPVYFELTANLGGDAPKDDSSGLLDGF
jgi:hypothetical protein